MAISYLHGHPWSRWSREERLFCAALYDYLRQKPADSIQWLANESQVGTIPSGEWDIGFEVCFYRDFLWHHGRSARNESFSCKRTFDLCFFHEALVIIIEAKVCEAFNDEQTQDFLKDAAEIRRVLQHEDLKVLTVALASSRYFNNASKYGKPGTLACFAGRLSWKQVNERYPDPLFAQAESLYKLRPGDLLK